MSGYAKLFSSILDSSIWFEPDHVRIVWIALLAMADRNGEVHAAVPGVANRARVSLEQCQEALARFMAPDPFSRTKDHDGRRLDEVDGGWVVLNYLKHRDLQSTESRRSNAAERKRRQRDRSRSLDVTQKRDTVTHERDTSVTCHAFGHASAYGYGSGSDDHNDPIVGSRESTRGGPEHVTPVTRDIPRAAPGVSEQADDPTHAPQPETTPAGQLGGINGPCEAAPAKPKRGRAKTAAHPLPPDWTPNEKHRDMAGRMGLDCDREAGRMRDFAAANPKFNAKADWDATFRNWLDNAFDRLPSWEKEKLQAKAQLQSARVSDEERKRAFEAFRAQKDRENEALDALPAPKPRQSGESTSLGDLLKGML